MYHLMVLACGSFRTNNPTTITENVLLLILQLAYLIILSCQRLSGTGALIPMMMIGAKTGIISPHTILPPLHGFLRLLLKYKRLE